jgi:prepilin-type N-terminal cleavage/methylation domain-containing protein
MSSAPLQHRLFTSSKRGPRKCARSARGFTLTEVIVVVVIIGLAFLFLLVMVPQGREQARLVACRKNLGQIGIALALYDQSHQRLPAVALPTGFDGPSGTRAPGPLRTLLETLQLPDLTELEDTKTPAEPQPGQVPGEMPVPGFVCASDPNATAGWFAAPISYRATTGDSPAGENGSFAPGRVLSLKDVEAADGSSYTAAFSERLVGDNQPNHPTLCNYQVVPGPLSGSKRTTTADGSGWRGDAGSSWTWSDYRSTLYNHALPVIARNSSLAIDGKTAYMGASSGHVRGVNLLLLDDSVTLVTPTVDPKVWKELARVNPPERE